MNNTIIIDELSNSQIEHIITQFMKYNEHNDPISEEQLAELLTVWFKEKYNATASINIDRYDSITFNNQQDLNWFLMNV
jgi:hypothetical protein